MSLVDLFNSSNRLIRKYGEEFFPYIYTNAYDELPYLDQKKKAGVILRILVFCRNIVTRVGHARVPPKVEYLYFSGSKNQFDSLRACFKAHGKTIKSSMLLDGPATVVNSEKRFEVVRLEVKPLIITILLFMLRAPSLFFRMRQVLYRQRQKYFDRYCACYIYVPYFYHYLQVTRPKMVVMSNDHSPANRSLLYVCKDLGIKTAYMQHASVSSLFPPLEFDYSFLDGAVALEHYRLIPNNRQLTMPVASSIFLTGQKKQVSRDAQGEALGLGFSHLDSNKDIFRCIQRFASFDSAVSVRLHPSHSESSVAEIEEFVKLIPNVEINSAKNQPVSEYLESIAVFFGTITSLHLEIALTGVPVYALEGLGNSLVDYYGYVKSGLCRSVVFDEVDRQFVQKIEFKQSESEILALQNYSATFGTIWQNREGELVAKIIEELEMEKSQFIDDIFQLVKDNQKVSIFNLRKADS